jgi:hypothetical protein
MRSCWMLFVDRFIFIEGNVFELNDRAFMLFALLSIASRCPKSVALLAAAVAAATCPPGKHH